MTRADEVLGKGSVANRVIGQADVMIVAPAALSVVR
jgi:hypothetical protein